MREATKAEATKAETLYRGRAACPENGEAGRKMDGTSTETGRNTDRKLMDVENKWHVPWNMDGKSGRKMDGTRTEDGRKTDRIWTES